MSELRTQRERQAALDESFDRSDAPPTDCSAATLLTTTTVGTYPTSASAFYACFANDVGGVETEGTAATYSTGTAIVYALNIGSAVPPSGTKVVAHAVGGRWVFRWDG